MRLIRGTRLLHEQREEVKRLWPERWTTDNPFYRGRCPACAANARKWLLSCEDDFPAIPPEERLSPQEEHESFHQSFPTDAEWFADNAFYVLDNGHVAPVDCHSLGERFKSIMQSAPRSVRRGWLRQRRRVRHLLKQHWPDPSGLDNDVPLYR
jgi:hypothetical protein